jgi:hypothetical protein
MVATFTVLLLLPAPKPDAPATPQPTIRQALANLDYSEATASTRIQTSNPTASKPKKQRSVGRQVTGAALGAVGGFIAGTFVAGLVMKDPSQPPPLPQGLLIGGPIGAFIGAALGAKYF